MISKTLIPGFCCFGITDKCMLRCKMCHKWKDDLYIKNPQSPSVKEWNQCVADLAQMVNMPFELDIGGGEALLFDGVLDVVRFSVDKGFNTSLASNGYLIDKDMAKRIADSGLKLISLSLDSLKEQTHDYLRGVDGVYKKVMGAIEYLHKYCQGLTINLCCVLYQINQDEILDLVNWANKDAKICTINFMAAMQPNNTVAENNWWQGGHGFLWPRDQEKTVAVIDELIILKKNGVKIGNPVSQLKAFQSYYKEPDKFVKKKQCNMDRCVLISSIGDIFLCYDFEKIGNIKKDRLKDIWYSEKADRVRGDIAKCTKNCHHLINCFDEFDADFSEKEKSLITDSSDKA